MGLRSLSAARNTSSSGRSLGEGKDYPLQDSDLENSMDCIVHGVSQRRTRLSDFQFQFTNQPRLNKNLLQLQTSEESIFSTEPGSAVHPG